jgi:maltose/moltooligosaccharide transporter
MQSFFIGAGAVFASVLPWMFAEWFGVANTAPAGVVPDSVRYAFYVGAFFVALAVLWTVFTTREYSPADLAAFERAERGPNAVAEAASAGGASAGSYLAIGGGMLLVGGVATIILAQIASGRLDLAREALKVNDLYIVSVGLAFFGLLLIAAGLIKQRGRVDNPFSEIIDDMFSMPQTMRQLAVVQFFTWFALFAMWIYTTAGVAARHFGATDVSSAAFGEAGNWVGLLFAIYNGVAALVAFFLIPVIANRIGRKQTHALNLALGAAGLASILVIPDPQLLWIGMIGVGFAWASIVSVPYSILSGALPAKKMGVYMGIFNFFIVIPQLLAASILGVIVRYAFDGAAINALAVGGVSLFIAALATLVVKDDEKRAALA